MNSRRSHWMLLIASASVGLFVSNCTIKNASDEDDTAGTGNSAAGTNSGTAGTSSGGTAGTNNGAAGSSDGACTLGTRHFGCTCPGNLLGAQTCLADGSFGVCVCAMANGDAGASSTGGTGAGGTGASSGGYAGTGGAPACDAGIDPSDCYSCLSQVCAKEWAACSADNETTVAQPGDAYCLSQGATADPGQIELILNCVAAERAKGLVKRDVVRACGATMGDSADPQYFLWAPEEMTPATTDLMNCMADAPATAPADAGAWATDPTNFPQNGAPLPWPACTCAKMACTSGQ